MGKNKGFTLIELLIVLVIIGVISAVAIPKYRNYRHDVEDAELLVTLTALSDAVWRYRIEAGDFPPQLIASQLYPLIGVSVAASNYFEYFYTYNGGYWPVSGLSGVVCGLRLFDLNSNPSDETDGYYLGYSQTRLNDAEIAAMKTNKVKCWQIDDTWYRYSWCIMGEHAQ